MSTSNHDSGSRFSENLAPNVSPVGDLIYRTGRAIKLTDPQTLPIDIHNTFSRASTATYVDGGVLKYAAIDEVRRQDGIDLLEDAGENFKLTPNDFTNWAKGVGVTITTDAATGPDGTTTDATLFAPDGGTQAIWKSTSYNSTDKTITSSIFFNPLTATYVRFRSNQKNGATNSTFFVTYTIATKAFDFSATVTDASARVEELANGWMRLLITGTYPGDGTSLQLAFSTDGADTNIFGSQFEESDGTSYIDVGTRAADIVTNENSFLSHFDLVGNEVVQLGNQDGGSNIELVENSTFDNGLVEPWYGIQSPLLTVVNNQLNVENTVELYGRAVIALGILKGSYRLEAELISSDDIIYCYITTSLSGATAGIVGAKRELIQTYDDLDGDYYLVIGNGTKVIGDISIWDNVTFREILSGTQYIFQDATIQAILSHHEALDTASIANINQKPELLGELGINGSVTGVNIVLDDTDEFYLCSEVSGEVVVDARAGYGIINESVNFSSNTSGVGNTKNLVGNTVTLHNEAVTLQSYHPQIAGTVTDNVNGYYNVKVNVEITSGTAYLNQLVGRDWLAIDETVGVGKYEYNWYGIQAKLDVNNFNFQFNGTIEWVFGAIASIEITEIKNTSVVSDYLAAARINKLNNGSQTTAFELDAAGVLIATNDVANSAMLYGDSEIDTGLRLNLEESTVVQKISGELQNFDSPLTTEVTNMDGSGNTIDFVSPNTFIVHQENFTTVFWKPYIGFSGTFAVGEEYLFIANIVIDSGTAKLRAITYGDLDGNSVVKAYNEILNQGDKKTISVIGNLRTSGSNIVFSFDGTAYAEYDATIKMSVRKILGKSQTIQERVLTTEPKYYVNKVLQAIAPEPPDPTIPLQVTNTPLIGYPDTVDQVLATAKVFTYELTQVEVDAL